MSIEVKIHDVAFGGAGVGKLPNGKIVFVPYTLKGEVVRIRVIRSSKGFSEGELIEILVPSPYRTTPPCPYFGRCGGCQYQHATYEEQIRIKAKQLQDTLIRIGGFKKLPPLHIEAAAETYHYRNKISVHKGHSGEVGFYARDNKSIIDVEQCLIANSVVNAKLTDLRKSTTKPNHIALTDESQRGGGLEEGSFHQVNAVMASKLLEWLRRELKPQEASRLLDLYCGAGFFTLGLADCFRDLCGVDRDSRAIHAATIRARDLHLQKAQFFAASVEDQIDWLLKDVDLASAVVLVDPPREGLAPKVTNTLAQRPCAQLIYISCNPATCARDLKELTKEKYLLSKLSLFDMFPQTAHMEMVALLQPS